MNEFKKVLFIVNKFSGTGFQETLEGKILDAGQKAGVECMVQYTQARGHATELAKAAVNEKSFPLVVAVGGDGTVNEVAQGLLHSDVTMGILPKGSGNGLARHLGIPMKINESVNTLFKSIPVDMDTFTLNGKLSLNVSGIGFDGHIANLFGNNKKRGLQGYAKLTMTEFIKFKEFEAEITSSGKTIKRKSFVIAIANSSQYGNNARIAPAASVCDEILHICFLKKVPAYRLDFVYSFFKGKIDESAFCDFMQIKDMQVKLDKPMAYHIDGEPCGVGDQFEIKLLPHSLKMMVPHWSLKY